MSEAPETISDERLHKLAAMQTNDRIGRMTKDEHDSLIAEVIAGRAAIEKLREALKPFAKVADTWRSSPASVAPFSRFAPAAQPHRTLRRARRLLCRAGNNKHQMRVTHSALGLHAGQPPDRSEGFHVVQPGLAPRNKAWKWRQPNEMASEQRVGNQLGGVKPEKALSMRTRKSVLLARGSTKGGQPIPWRQKRVELCLSARVPHQYLTAAA